MSRWPSAFANRKTAGFALKILLTIGSLAWCFYIIDYQKIEQLLDQGKPVILLLFVPLVVIHTAIGALRFKLLADPHQPLSFLEHLRQYFIANYFNLILPSSIGGDAARVFMLSRHGTAKSKAATYIFSERLMGLYSLILIAASAGFSVALHDDVTYMVGLLIVISGASLIGIYILMAITRNITQYHVKSIRQAIKDLWQHKLRLYGAVALSLIYQLVTISFTILIAAAFDFDVPMLLMFALVPLIWLVTFLPISIGGVGIREMSFIGLFSQVGLASEQAILLSLGTYAAMLLAGAIGGTWALRSSLSKSTLLDENSAKQPE